MDLAQRAQQLKRQQQLNAFQNQVGNSSQTGGVQVDPLEQIMLMSLQARQDPYRPYTSGEALAGGAAGFGGQLQGALGQIGAMQAHNANTISSYNQQQNALNQQLQLAGMAEQGRNQRLATIAGMFGGGFSGGGRPGNITSNIGSGVSWSSNQNNQGPQAYQYGSPPPGSPQSYQPQQQGGGFGSGGGGGQQQSGYQPMAMQQPVVDPGMPAPFDRRSTNAARQHVADSRRATMMHNQGYQPQQPGQGNMAAYGPTSRYNRYRDEPPFVGGGRDALGNPLEKGYATMIQRANASKGYGV